MTLRQRMAAKIPALSEPTAISSAQMEAAADASIGHRIAVGLDAVFGQFGARLPYVTISARTALALFSEAQAEAEADPKAPGPIYTTAPFWALWLGSMLEARVGIPFITWLPFVSYPGHLQDAINADAARNLNALWHLAPKLAAKVSA